MWQQFIKVDGYAIAVDHISFVDFQTPGQATIHIGNNALVATGDDANTLQAVFQKEVEAPALPPARGYVYPYAPERLRAMGLGSPCGSVIHEVKHYADGSSASGPAPLPDHSPDGAPEVSADPAPLAPVDTSNV